MHISNFPSRSLLAVLPFSSRPAAPSPCRSAITRRPVVAAATSAESSSSSMATSYPTYTPKEEAKFGFKRWEMNKKSLAGTMGDEYDRHVFLCYKDPSAWVPKLETSSADPMYKRLAGAVRSRGKEINPKTRVTVCEGHAGTDFEDGDVLIFPDMVKYKGFNESNVESFIEEVLVKGQQWSVGAPEVLPGSHIFVCAHGSRDKRCGVCGPVLIEKLREGVEARGLTNQVFVKACSHTGGHKFAGNLIVFNPSSQGKVIGHWYGYVTPEDVPEILDQHIGNGVPLDRLLRGQMGGNLEGGKKVAERVVPNVESGCCQGADGSTCCQDASSQQVISQETKGVGKLSSWISSFNPTNLLRTVLPAKESQEGEKEEEAEKTK